MKALLAGTKIAIAERKATKLDRQANRVSNAITNIFPKEARASERQPYSI